MNESLLRTTLLLLVFAVGIKLNAQTRIESSPIYYDGNGNVGIGTSSPNAQLTLFKSTQSAQYPNETSDGDVFQFLRGSNNALQFGVSRGFNDRKAWILSRHSSTDGFGKYYSTLHLQPNIGNKSLYKGVAIGFYANQALENGAHLAVKDNVSIGTMSPNLNSSLTIYKTPQSSQYPTETTTGDLFQFMQANNNALEFGVARGSNARKAWILARHASTENDLGKHYGTLHLQPDIGNMSYYKGVAIGYAAAEDVSKHTHLSVKGKVGIGTLSPDEKLTVVGNIHATGKINTTEVVVNTAAGEVPDYVFEPDYKLTSLTDVEHYVKKHKHLPEIPSAKEVEAEGLELAKMNLLLLKKIEELTLHTIEQQKKIDGYEQRFKKIEEQLLKQDEEN